MMPSYEHGPRVRSVNVIGISSSPHENGSTSFLVSQVLQGASAEGAGVEEIWLPNYEIGPCRGCFHCLANGHCPIDDDFEEVLGRLKAADGIVIGSPTYGLAPNSVMKTLLDRLGMMNVYTGGLSDKYVVGVSCAGAAGANRVAKDLTKMVDGFFSSGMRTGSLGVVVGWGHARDDPLAARDAHDLGVRLVRDIRSHRTYRFQRLPSRIIAALFLRRTMRRNVLQNRDGKMRAVYLELHRRGVL